MGFKLGFTRILMGFNLGFTGNYQDLLEFIRI